MVWTLWRMRSHWLRWPLPRRPPQKRTGRKKLDSEEPDALLEEARALSEYIFEEDVVELARTEGWTLTLLTETGADGTRCLRGLLCYRRLPTQIYIERLAVPQQCRGRGFAKVLMRWLVGEASCLSRSECASLTCSAFDKVVPFYKSLGFLVSGSGAPPKGDEEDPQTSMELPIASAL